jgi:RimJ/RimL family protein N-acetyltransferase
VKPPASLTDGVVVLRRYREDDRAVALSTMRDPLVRRWLNMPAQPADRDFDSLLRTVQQGFRSGDRLDYAIVTRDDDTAYGAVVASRRARDNWELAYLAQGAGRGRGIVTRGVRVLADWLFTQGVGRLEIRTHPDNEASQRVAERAGFVREGRERRSIWLHGERVDALVWSRLPDDPSLG